MNTYEIINVELPIEKSRQIGKESAYISQCIEQHTKDTLYCYDYCINYESMKKNFDEINYYDALAIKEVYKIKIQKK